MKRKLLALSSNPKQTIGRWDRLEAYWGVHVLDGDRFACHFGGSCRESHTGAFYEGQAHHIGRHFDLSIDGRPLRIVIVGQEYGHPPAHVSLAARREMIVNGFGTQRRFFTEGRHASRNPHMRGTTSLLRLMLGKRLGSDYEGEFVLIGKERVHIFECFALVDFLLCSAVVGEQRTLDDGSVPKGGTRGASTATMHRNCSTHYRRAIEILEPTVIVAQGKGVRRWMDRVIDRAEPAHSLLPIERVTIGSVECYLLTFSHPAAPTRENWGMNERQPYLLETVAPTIETWSTILRHGL